MAFSVKTLDKRQIVDITDRVQSELSKAGLSDGVAVLTVLHTTAALTTADLDPGTDEDFLDFLQAITPMVYWRHPHDPAHTPDHILASLIGPSISLEVQDGRPVLGSWQRIVLVELDGPRDRSISLVVLSS